MEHTESCRVMRGAWETDTEYILELHGRRKSCRCFFYPANGCVSPEKGYDGDLVGYDGS